MSKKIDSQARGKYTLEFKLEAMRLVKRGKSAAVTAKVLGIPNQTLDNWIRLGSNLDRWSKLKNKEMKVKKLIELLNQRFDMDTLMDLREAYALCLIDKVDGLLPVSAPVAQARACMALCSDITSIPSPKG